MRRTLLLLVLLASGCAARTAPTFYLPNGQTVAPPPLAADNIKATQLARGDNSSIAAVQIRDREEPHVHTRYDLTVVLTQGHGTLWLNGQPLAMQAGDAAYIARGTPHYFVNDSDEPALAIVVSSPPFSGPDQAPAK